MIIQTANIVAGFVLAAPKLKEFGGVAHIESAEAKLHPMMGTIGTVELVLGIVALLHRMGIVYFSIPFFGSSYPQALAAIAIGLILSASWFEKYPSVHEYIVQMMPYRIWIGLAGMAVGIFSII